MLRYYFNADYWAGRRYALWGDDPDIRLIKTAEGDSSSLAATNTETDELLAWGDRSEISISRSSETESLRLAAENSKAWLAGIAAGEKRRARKPHGVLSTRRGEKLVREWVTKANALGDEESAAALRGILHDNNMARRSPRRKRHI